MNENETGIAGLPIVNGMVGFVYDAGAKALRERVSDDLTDPRYLSGKRVALVLDEERMAVLLDAMPRLIQPEGAMLPVEATTHRDPATLCGGGAREASPDVLRVLLTRALDLLSVANPELYSECVQALGVARSRPDAGPTVTEVPPFTDPAFLPLQPVPITPADVAPAAAGPHYETRLDNVTVPRASTVDHSAFAPAASPAK